MRKILISLAVLALIAAACSQASDEPSPEASDTESAAPTAETAQACAENATFVSDGTLTIATGNPAYPPWWEGGETDGDWQINDPANNEGFEGQVAYAVADKLGFAEGDVAWEEIAFEESYAPGPKDFDFVLQQISYTAKRAKAVDFSESYYDVNQALVTTGGSSIEGATTVADLADAKLGAPIGTTSLAVIEDVIQPSQEASVYNNLNAAITALENGSIDGIIVDLPTAFYITAAQMDDGVIVGQFEGGDVEEYFGLVLEKDSSLTECVNLALGELRESGELDAIQQEWLADNADAPVIAA